MLFMTSQLVLEHTADGVRTLTLHNPERRNAWSVEMEEQYFALLDEADADSTVRSIVVTGSGKAFCPGLDVQRLSALTAQGKMDLRARRPQTHPLQIRKPMIAAINGACAGIGLMQALNCDVRFAARWRSILNGLCAPGPARGVRQLMVAAPTHRRRARGRPPPLSAGVRRR